MPGQAIVVQAFNKPDTLADLLNSLLRCRGHENFDLWIWTDNFAGSLREQEFKTNYMSVRSLCETFCRLHAKDFRKLEFMNNDRNCGPYQTCQMAINAAFNDVDAVIFTEDDTVFATDALEWFGNALANGILEQDGNWAIAGESIFFDSRRNCVTDEFIEQSRKFAISRAYFNKFVRLQFLPSTCFATNAARWDEFGITRGLPIGDNHVNERCVREGKFCVFPVIPRVKDVGMLHPFGHSVTIHGQDGVREIKRTYLMSDALSGPAHYDFEPLPATEIAPLFHRSVNLAGFR